MVGSCLKLAMNKDRQLLNSFKKCINRAISKYSKILMEKIELLLPIFSGEIKRTNSISHINLYLFNINIKVNVIVRIQCHITPTCSFFRDFLITRRIDIAFLVIMKFIHLPKIRDY